MMKAIGKKAVKDLQLGDIFSVNESEFDETAQVRYNYNTNSAEDIRNIKDNTFGYGTPMSNLDWHTFHWLCYRSNRVDICVPSTFSCHQVPTDDTQVFFFGRRVEEKYMTDEERKQKANEIWSRVFAVLPYEIRSKIENTYYVKLFGKRGYYDESGVRSYLKNSLIYLRELEKIINGRVIKKVSATQEDDMEDLEYSRRYETECYGGRHTYLEIEFSNNTKETFYY